jgi:hypothetical protein
MGAGDRLHRRIVSRRAGCEIAGDDGVAGVVSSRVTTAVPTKERVWAKGKVIHIHALERHTDLRALNFFCDWLLRNPNAKEIIFVFEDGFRIFPNAMAPLAALLCFLESVGINAKIHNNHASIAECAVFEPVQSIPCEQRSDPSNLVWEYRDSNELEFLIDLVVSNLYRKVSSQKNTLLALEYCLSEIMDNVLRHSKDQAGFFMYTLQRDNQRISISVADQGIGIHRSFANTVYHPVSASDAITLAMRKGVTSSPDGAGNGLWTTTEIITKNTGQLTITSGGGAIYYNKSIEKTNSYDDIPTIDPRWPGTNLDFQLDFHSDVDFKSLWGDLPSPVNTRTERLENSEDEVVLRIKEQSFGTSTRESGKEIRVLAANLLRTQERDVLLDFSDVTMVSSSYADELVAKILADHSIAGVSTRLHVFGANSTVNLIISDAVRSRKKLR